jgi:hypothetical protein
LKDGKRLSKFPRHPYIPPATDSAPRTDERFCTASWKIRDP